MGSEIEKYGLIAAAVALFFWPQIQKFLQSKGPAQEAKGSAPGNVNSRTVGSDRSEWVADLMAMQRVLQSNGQNKAADLIAESMVLIVGMKTDEAKK